MRRKDGWEARLQAVFSNFKDKPFEYGFHDCALFVCNCIREMTGEDLARKFRRRYRNHKGALLLLSQARGGFEGILERVAAQKEIVEISPLFAQRGDVLLVETKEGAALAIVDLTGEKAIGPGPVGLVSWKLSCGRRAWRI